VELPTIQWAIVWLYA